MASRGELLGLLVAGEVVLIGGAILLAAPAETLYTIGPVVVFFAVVLWAYVGARGRD